MSNENARDWQVRAALKRSQCEGLIPPGWKLPSTLERSLEYPLEASKNNLIELDIPRQSGILTEKELHITEAYDVRHLLGALASGGLSSLEVTTCCLTEILFEQAFERAQHLDALRERGQLAGPLHGLPISLKDSFQVRGSDATLGLVAYLDNGPSEAADSHNHIFGRTLNPWNTSLTAGGSTGGEGALIALRGSPLGVGTDVAGSVRIPALCCGVYGFKPTAGRTPYGKQAPITDPGLHTISPSAGPLANDLDALEILTKSVVDSRPARVDSTAIDVPWRSAGPLNPVLRFGVLAEDPLFPWHPPIKKVVADTADLLKAQGHEVIYLTSQQCLVGESYDVASQMFGLDKTSARILAHSGEPMVPSLLYARQAARGVSFNRSFLRDTRSVKDRLERLSILNVKMSDIQEAWRKVWVECRLDAVIGPGAQNTAVEHDMYALAPYTCLFNLLDYPACVIPVGHVEKPDKEESFLKSPGQFAPPYRPEDLEGAPVAIQIITTRMRDEECLAIARLIDKYVRPGVGDGMSVAKL
ncbi:hypothetical protein VMCG_08092 [Cytospora schulzeri]|uniref:Amidase domain-containing protein n=1 Tax=Cytospora schulzeri TaxID=448051 RepID=A0A423VRN1_9PEZI|nr:hypothetical protein VMCG_08092 [Valsa malicola]